MSNESKVVAELVKHINESIDNDGVASFVNDALQLMTEGALSVERFAEVNAAADAHRKMLETVGDKRQQLPAHCRILSTYTTTEEGKTVQKKRRVPQLAPAGNGRTVAPATVANMASWYTCAPQVIQAILDNDLLPEDSPLPAEWAVSLREAADLISAHVVESD